MNTMEAHTRSSDNNGNVDNSVESLLKSAKLYYSRDDYQHAIEYAGKALALEDSSIEALHILSYSYYYQKIPLKRESLCIPLWGFIEKDV